MVLHSSPTSSISVRVSALIGLFAAVAVAGAACDKMPLLAPSGTSITLVATSSQLPVNGSTEVTAILIEGGLSGGNGTTPPTVSAGVGTPVHNGTRVTFSTTIGRMEPVETQTEGGRAVSRLIADGRSGTAVVTAFSGSARQTLELKIGSANATRIAVTASPQSVNATGGTATITARVEDAQGAGVLGVPVSFSTSAGTLGATSVVTDSNGVATTTLTTTAAATVTATSGGGSTGTLSGTVNVTVKPRIDITITPPANAVESAPAVFTIGVGTGPLITDASIDFGDGTVVQLGSLSASRQASHFYGRFGIYTVTVTATDSEGQRVSSSTSVAVGSFTASGTASPTSTTLGNSILFSVTVEPNTVHIARYEWDFGDGTVNSDGGRQQSYIFKSRGTKIVRVRVFPVAGSSKTVLISVDIS